MIAYNITTKILPEMESSWVYWQQQEHIPEIMALGCFTRYQFFRLLEQDETEGITYIVQYFASSVANYERYVNEEAPAMRQKAVDKWGNRFIAFRTVMELVH